MPAACSSYVICTSPRSGSTLLCNLLTQTGLAGRPGSHFHEPSLEAWLEAYGLDAPQGGEERAVLERVFRAAIGKGSGGTGMFGLRLQRRSFDFFAAKLARLYPRETGDAARMAAAFGPVRFLYLKREDKVAQAVSRLRAEQSGLWHRAPDGREIERLAPPGPLRYDGAALGAYIETQEENERGWEDWFAREGLDPLRLSYEGLAADPGGTLRRVLSHLGLPEEAAEGIEPGVGKLADATSRDWAARYRAEEGRR